MKPILKALGIIFLIAALVAGSRGYKVYGKATVIDNRSLKSKAGVIAKFEKPNVVVTEGGARIAIEDFEVSDFAAELSLKEIGSLLLQPDYVHAVADSSFPSGYAIELRSRYSCGMTFLPKWLPRRLPGYRMEDLGEALRQSYLSAESPVRFTAKEKESKTGGDR